MAESLDFVQGRPVLLSPILDPLIEDLDEPALAGYVSRVSDARSRA